MPKKGKFPPWAFFTLVSFVVFFKSLVLGQSYFHDDLLLYVGPSWGFLKNQMALGHFPFWNHFLFGGQPFFADPNNMAAYPLLYPALLFPVPYCLGAFLFIHLILSAAGMRFLLRNLSWSEEACRVGAATFALSGFAASELIHPPILAAFSWMPWFFGFLLRALGNPNLQNGFGAGLSFALLFLSGNYQMSLMVFYGSILFALTRVFFEKKTGNGWLALGGFLWGAFPLVLFLVPSLEFIRHSDRMAKPLGYGSFNSNLSLVPGAWTQFLFPQSPAGPVFKPYEATLDNVGFLGLWAPFLLLWALAGRVKYWKNFCILGACAYLLAWGPYLPFHRWACQFLPGLDLLRVPARFTCLYTFALSALAAGGYEFLLKNFSSWGNHRGPVFFALAYALAIGITAIGKAPDPVWPLICLTAGLGAIVAWSWWGHRSHWPQRLFQVVVLFSLVMGFWQIAPVGPASNFDYAAQMPALPALQKASWPGRLFLEDRIPYETHSGQYTYWAKFPVNAASSLGLGIASGYDSIHLREFSEVFSLPPFTFARLMAVEGFLTGLNDPEVRGIPQWKAGKARFDRCLEAHPLVWAAGNVKTMADPGQELAALGGKEFNPYMETLLSEPSPSFPFSSNGRPFSLSWNKTIDGMDEEDFQVNLERPGFVVFSEVVYPGWKAQIDGHPARLYTADYLLRSLFVPAGEHFIRFCYRPWWLIPLITLGILWIFSLAVWGFLARSPKV